MPNIDSTECDYLVIGAGALNIAAGLADHAAEPGRAIGSYVELTDRAIENLGTLRLEPGDDGPLTA